MLKKDFKEVNYSFHRTRWADEMPPGGEEHKAFFCLPHSPWPLTSVYSRVDVVLPSTIPYHTIVLLSWVIGKMWPDAVFLLWIVSINSHVTFCCCFFPWRGVRLFFEGPGVRNVCWGCEGAVQWSLLGGGPAGCLTLPGQQQSINTVSRMSIIHVSFGNLLSYT